MREPLVRMHDPAVPGAVAAVPGAAAEAADGAVLTTPAVPQAPVPAAAASGAGRVAPAPGTPPPSPPTALEATIRLGAEQGFSRARITLRPPELGAVDVVLKAAGGGVSATVLAHTPEAAQLLEASGHELRVRLEAQGVQLQALSVSVAGDAAAGAGHEARGEAGAPGARLASSPAPDTDDQLPTTTRQIQLGGGVLVDVLA